MLTFRCFCVQTCNNKEYQKHAQPLTPSFVRFSTATHHRLVKGSRHFQPPKLLDFFFFLFVDIFYIIGGSTDPGDKDGVSYEVITVNLKTGDIGQASDTLYATNAAAAASSRQRIALCGGDVASEARDYCQIYSPVRDEYV